jgi:hypothetical protein
MALALVAISSLLIGFLAGLLTFKRKQQWCERCGAVKTCPDRVCTATSIRPAKVAHQ